MASSLFSSDNPFKRKPDNEAAAESRKRKKKNENVDDDDSKAVDRKANKSGKRKLPAVEEADSGGEDEHADEDMDSGDDEAPGGQREEMKYDAEEKMQRTIFVGNLPLSTKKKTLIREFSSVGAIESARLRSVPLGSTKMPRRGAVITGQVSENRSSLNGYVVFKDVECARAALAYNMREFEGKHIRVDIAQPRSQLRDNSVAYDKTRSIFVGNLPLDVEDEEIYSLFVDGSPEAELEAVRVVRDPKSNLGKGFAFVLFKNKAGVKHTFDRGALKLRGRELRIRRVGNPVKEKQKPAGKSRLKRANPRRNRRPVPEEKKKARSYEGTRASEKKQQRKAPPAKTKQRTTEKSEPKKKRPAVAARKARSSSVKQNNPA